MRLGRMGPLGSEIPVLHDRGEVFDLRSLTDDIDGGFFARGGLALVREAHGIGALATLPGADALRIGAPISRPNKIVCIGLNYRDHAAETDAEPPAEPIVFMKDPMTLVGPFDDVRIPRGSTKTDWEVELGVVIGSEARYVGSPEQAIRHVAGYAVSHDVSEREFQIERGGQWDKGKSCETFNPFGPLLVTRDEIDDPQSLDLRLSVNGVERQSGTTADMIFSVAHLVWYLSQFMVLYPGDVINTGTPAGVALGMAEPAYLRAGDRVDLSIQGLGIARQRMVAA